MLVTNAAVTPCPSLYNLTIFVLLKTEPHLCWVMYMAFKFCKFNCVYIYFFIDWFPFSFHFKRKPRRGHLYFSVHNRFKKGYVVNNSRSTQAFTHYHIVRLKFKKKNNNVLCIFKLKPNHWKMNKNWTLYKIMQNCTSETDDSNSAYYLAISKLHSFYEGPPVWNVPNIQNTTQEQ